MKLQKLPIIVILTFLACIGLYSTLQAAPIAEDSALETAQTFASSIINGDTAKADSMTSDELLVTLKKMGYEGWAPFWQTIIGQIGTPSPFLGCYIFQTLGEMQLVRLPVETAVGKLDMQIAVEKDGSIGGLQFMPYVDRSAKSPSYADPRSFSEVDVDLVRDAKAVKARISIPIGRSTFPAVVLLSGSGPNDMDETVGPNKVFRDLAWGLATRGIASIRFDKRTRLYMPTPTDEINMLNFEYFDDAREAIKVISGIPGVSRVVVLGHSEGAMLAPKIVEQSPNVSAIAAIAGPITPLPETVVRQYSYLASLGLASPEQALDIERETAAYRAGVMPTDGTVGILPVTYIRELEAVGNPAVTAASLKKPIFLAFGDRDYQVLASELELWLETLKQQPDIAVATKVYAGMNHLLIKGEGPPSPVEYQTSGFIMIELIDDLAAWIYSL